MMVVLQTTVSVNGITGRRVGDFFINCTDADYQKWWPGTHLEFHTLDRKTGEIGSLVYFDEFVGKHRLQFKGRVTRYEPGKVLEYRLAKGLPLPAWLVLEFQDRPGRVDIVHTVKAGFQGWGSALDPLIRLHLSNSFEKALNEHAHTEFSKLGDLLR